MGNICILCSIKDVAEEYKKDAHSLAVLIGKSGHTLVWGGADKGLMKVVADGAQNAGGKIIGITSVLFEHEKRNNADEMIIVENISKTKELLRNKSDVIVLLAGGTGTLDEICEILELKKHNLFTKPVVVLNTNNFYEGFKMQLERMESEGFLKKKLDEFLFFASSPLQVMEYIHDYNRTIV